jgi:hypothetical protein
VAKNLKEVIIQRTRFQKFTKCEIQIQLQSITTAEREREVTQLRTEKGKMNSEQMGQKKKTVKG